MASYKDRRIQPEVSPVSFMYPEAASIADLTADLAAIVGNIPGLKVHRDRPGGGVEWITVTWPGREIIMERLVNDAEWSVFDPSLDDAIGTGATPADALRAALAHG